MRTVRGRGCDALDAVAGHVWQVVEVEPLGVEGFVVCGVWFPGDVPAQERVIQVLSLVAVGIADDWRHMDP